MTRGKPRPRESHLSEFRKSPRHGRLLLAVDSAERQLAASISDPGTVRSDRQFAAFRGLVPRQSSSGGKERLGRISKMRDGYLRRLLVVGATAVMRRVGYNPTVNGSWIRSLMERKPAW